MGLSGVTLTQIDGALGVIPTTVGDTAALIGPATAGALNTAAAFARGTAVATNFTSGPLVELANYVIGKPAVCIRSTGSTIGAYGSVTMTNDTTIKGTSVPTADATYEPRDEYEVYIKVIVGGSIGVAGITYQSSLDGGRTLSVVIALGTATSITLTAENVKIDLAGGTLVAGDYIEVRTTPPTDSVANLQTALAALAASSLVWDVVVLANPVDAARFSALDSWLDTQWTAGKHKKAIVNFRGPTEGESEADYLIAAAVFRASNTSKYILVCGGYAKTISSVNGRQYRRPVAWPVAKRAVKIKRPTRTDLGQVAGTDGGPLPSDVKIRDTNGNPDEHDEAYSPGLDDLQFCTLRTREGYSGVYIEKPWVFAPTGSDYFLYQYRSVVNRVADAVSLTLTARLRSPVLVDATTGFIKEEEALDIENAVDAAVRAVVGPGPDVSAHKFTLSRTDALLSSNAPELTGEERIVPLAYPNTFGISIGFVNPARGQVA